MADQFQSNSMEDLFDSSLCLEDNHMKQGFEEGYEAGIMSGREDARHLGLKHGFETGELLGFYNGCSSVWNSALQLHPARFSSQVQKQLKEFQVLIDDYPLLDPEDENIDKIKDDLRVKFNMICASLGVSKKNIEYRGYPKTSSALEF
ncbi:PREDICTED: oral cancer-overexpressed protein 1 homolog [Tarenaya hassleriana]|uniref:oral cancer-overexpressed protein 1 homolog n=1 Tax=Tarenaya hassleriana TaxID=28532 RepID=UPI00053C785D|nr:PREDICTED: oral cancer-overexpressed protein 1 homolog [Tarenaya hassleriana]